MSLLDKILIESTKLKDAAVILASLFPAFQPIVMGVITMMNVIWPHTKPVFDPDTVAAEIAKEREVMANDDVERNKRRTEPEDENGDDGQ